VSLPRLKTKWRGEIASQNGTQVADRTEEVDMPERIDKTIVETTTEARQGVTGHNVRYVLVFGTIGAVLALAILYFAFFR
jgi:hypothetical protein